MKRVLIDLTHLRQLDNCRLEAIDPHLQNGKTFKTIREIASFWSTCRRCQDAPCINVCPADALDKDENGMINRALNLCIRCKSCITACPFGTLMNDLFAVKTQGYTYFDLNNELELEQFAAAYEDEVVRVVEFDANPEEHIFKLSERVLIKDISWSDSIEN